MRIGVGLSIPELATRGGRFSPASLFTAGTVGAWYDPSDYSTLFQDSAGTTPVTAVEQPVGLMLDKSQGATLGPQLLTNGSFTTDLSGWTTATTLTNTVTWVSPSAARLNVQTISGDCSIGQGTFVSGQWYKLSFTATLISGGAIRVQGPLPSAYIFTASGNYVQYFQATSTSALTFTKHAATAVWDITNVSISAINGNHASQSTSTSRPVLRARYNLLTYSEQFDNAAWTKTNVTADKNQATSPAGTTTANLVTLAAGTLQKQISRGSLPTGSGHVFSIYLKAGTLSSNFVQIALGGSVSFIANVNVSTGTFGTNNLSGTITSVGDSWYRVTVTSQSSWNGNIYILAVDDGTAGYAPSTSATGTFYIWGADLRTGSSAGTYQRIAAATDYATAGFLPYLAFDGTDDFMVTGNINLSGTDKANVLFGATQLSAANYGGVASFGPTVNNAGSFLVWLRSTAGGGQVESYARGSTSGTTGNMTTNAALAVPSTFVWSTLYDIGQSTIAAEIIQRQNGAVVASTGTSAAGTGNFGNLALHIGRYDGTNYLNGRLYQMIIPGKALSASELASAETWNATKTGVTL